MLKTIVIEDEVLALDRMKLLINRHEKFEMVAAFSNPFEALDIIPTMDVDVLLIDIEMPGISGIELAEHVKRVDLQIVFVTAHHHYAVDAFRIEATDYLIKPITHKMLDSLAVRLENARKTSRIQHVIKAHYDVTVQCFGVFMTTNHTGDIVRFPTKKTEELFAYFIVNKGRIINKWAIADKLWPEMDGEKVLHNVYNAVYRLRQTFKTFTLPLAVDSTNEGYVLKNDGKMYVDLYQLWDVCNMANITTSQLQLFHDLYIGPLFNDKDYSWAVHLRENLAMAYHKNSKL